MKEIELFNLFEKVAVKSGGEFYIPIYIAREFITECNQNDFSIIGIECFQIKNKKLIPDLEKVADFSSLKSQTWYEQKMKCNKDAENFVRHFKRFNDLYLNFTLLSKSDWEHMNE